MSTASWTYSKTKLDDDFQFSEYDLDHRFRIYNKYSIIPESLESVRVDFLIQKEKLVRYVIKELDILLKVNGIFEINLIDSKNHSSYFLSRDQVQYEFSISTDGRYVLTDIEKNGIYLKLIYTKKIPILSDYDSINKWSFGIITNGKKLDSVNHLINTIIDQKIPEFEIIICGPYPTNQNVDYRPIRILSDVELKEDIRFPISAKKNKIISDAKFENLCILHDRFSLPSCWFDQMKLYGNYFDYLCLPTLDQFHNRFAVDWMTFGFPLTRRLYRNNSLKYSEWSTDLIIQGGAIVGKSKKMRRYKIDERLHWGELEDLHFSKVAYLDGAFISIDHENYFYSESVNHISLKNQNLKARVKNHFGWIYSIFISYCKFKKAISQFSK
jgi:hypothetical protein